MVNVEVIERDLAREGHRVTAPRHVLLQALNSLGDHFSAEALAAAAPGVGRATVFRTLRLLQSVGAVCQVVLNDGAVQYRLTTAGHHHHIVCSRCGVVNDFVACDITDLLEELARRTGYDIAAHRLEVYGTCAGCQTGLGATARPGKPTSSRSA